MNQYEQQATDFCNKYGVVIETKFLRYGKYWEDDKQERNIYEVTLKKDGKTYTFNFGQSINQSCETVTRSIKDKGEKIPVYCGVSRGNKISGSVKFDLIPPLYEITSEEVEKLAEQLCSDFVASAKEYNKSAKQWNRVNVNDTPHRFIAPINRAIQTALGGSWEEYIERKEKTPPTAYDILACLTKYDPHTFEDFCADFGYDTDSRKAERTYKAVKEEWNGLQALFNNDELTELQEIN